MSLLVTVGNGSFDVLHGECHASQEQGL